MCDNMQEGHVSKQTMWMFVPWFCDHNFYFIDVCRFLEIKNLLFLTYTFWTRVPLRSSLVLHAWITAMVFPTSEVRFGGHLYTPWSSVWRSRVLWSLTDLPILASLMTRFRWHSRLPVPVIVDILPFFGWRCTISDALYAGLCQCAPSLF